MLFLFSKFKEKKWKKLTYEKRFLVLCALEKKVARNLEIEPLKLVIHPDSQHWNCFGAFNAMGGEKFIYINEQLIDDPVLRFHAMETIAHETRHAYQFEATSRKLKWYEFTAKKWKRNWAGYFSSTSDNLMYNNQSVERDAQKYSIKFLKKYRYKYRNDYVFQKTLENVVNRYEKSDEEARKKYGFFYKYKIEKNVKKNAKY
ncbi:MAG: hypothetical protein IJ538_04770 [Clostridia bacterium]|nr:hypothetical protein [Clostridia bacterium]